MKNRHEKVTIIDIYRTKKSQTYVLSNDITVLIMGKKRSFSVSFSNDETHEEIIFRNNSLELGGPWRVSTGVIQNLKQRTNLDWLKFQMPKIDSFTWSTL